MTCTLEVPREAPTAAEVEACLSWLDALDNAGDDQAACAGCHFWHFGCCVHVSRIGTVGDGRCSHRKTAHSIF